MLQLECFLERHGFAVSSFCSLIVGKAPLRVINTRSVEATPPASLIEHFGTHHEIVGCLV